MVPKNVRLKYIKRYRNGESPGKLGLEIKLKYNIKVRSPKDIVFRWEKDERAGKYSPNYKKKGRGKNRLSREQIVDFAIQKRKELHWKEVEDKEQLLLLCVRFKNPHLLTKKERFFKIYEDRIFSKNTLFSYFNVSSSGYYTWLPKKKLEGRYDKLIMTRVKESYQESRGVFGAQRIRIKILRKYGETYNIKTIYRYMMKAEIKSIIRRKVRKSTPNKPSKNNIPNLINGDFKGEYFNHKIFSDTSEFYFKGEKWIICVVVDGFNNEILSFSTGKNKTYFLVEKSLNKINFRSDRNTIFHTDNGSEYTSKLNVILNLKLGNKMSTTKPGNPLQNRPGEWIINILKTEYFIFFDEDSKTMNMIECIESYVYNYNNKRFQSELDWLTPLEYKKKSKNIINLKK